MKLTIALLTCAALALSSVQKRQAVYWVSNDHRSPGQLHYASHPRFFRYPYVIQFEDEEATGGESSVNPFGYLDLKSGEESNQRYFFNSNSSPDHVQALNGVVVSIAGNVYYYNRLVRPIYVVTTKTILNTVTSICIQKSYFANNSENKICSGSSKNKRKIIELMDGDFDIAPNQVLRVELTASPNMFNAHHSNGPAYLESSQTEEPVEVPRPKRTFNIIASVTITATASTTKNITITQTLEKLLAPSGLLTCRPSDFVVC